MDEPGLNDEQRRKLRDHMSAELARLSEELRTLAAMTRPVAPDRAIGRLSRLEAMNEKSMNEATMRAAQQLQTRIRMALNRLDDDDYGLCADCAAVIPFQRLKTMPGTRLCVGCAGKAER
jgi:DnaK suppressor protein